MSLLTSSLNEAQSLDTPMVMIPKCGRSLKILLPMCHPAFNALQSCLKAKNWTRFVEKSNRLELPETLRERGGCWKLST